MVKIIVYTLKPVSDVSEELLWRRMDKEEKGWQVTSGWDIVRCSLKGEQMRVDVFPDSFWIPFIYFFYAVFFLFHFSLDVCRRRLANQERRSLPSPAFPVDFMFLVALLFIRDTNWPSSSLEKIYTWQRNINRINITSCVPLYLLPAASFPKSCQHVDVVPCKTAVK